MSGPFDIESIKAGMSGEQSKIDECLTWCVAALRGFQSAATEVGTPVISLDMKSVAAQASGIAKASWPTSIVGGQQVAQYYRILTNSEFSHAWPAADGQGLTFSTNGQLFLQGNSASVSDVAAYLVQLTRYDLEQLKEIFNAALRGEAYSVG